MSPTSRFSLCRVPIPSTFFPIVATVDLTALAHNLRQIRRILSPGVAIMAVVKANAYGHGATETAEALIREGVDRLAVFSIEEGVALRQAGITESIVILGPVFRQQCKELFAHQLVPVVSDPSTLEALQDSAPGRSSPYPIHLKIETGMGRLGLTQEELENVLVRRTFPSSLYLEGLMSHLADADGLDPDSTDRQISRFKRAIQVARDAGFKVPLVHLSNSAGIVRFQETHHSLVRPGIMLYGYHTMPPDVQCPELRPVLSLTTCIAQLRLIQPGETVSYNCTFMAKRRTRIAVLPVGYSTGVNRQLSNRGQVLIRGRRATIAGIVCMDMVMVDVTDIPDVTVGDEVVLIGEQGGERITARDVAEWTKTIPYEVLCAISPKIPRLYRNS